MIKIKSIVEQKFKKFITFFYIGIISVLIDYLIYRGINSLVHDILISKAIGFVSGTLFSFIGNRKFTFDTNFSVFKLVKYFILYMVTLNLNIYTNKFFLLFFDNSKYATQYSFFFCFRHLRNYKFFRIKLFCF